MAPNANDVGVVMPHHKKQEIHSLKSFHHRGACLHTYQQWVRAGGAPWPGAGAAPRPSRLKAAASDPDSTS